MASFCVICEKQCKVDRLSDLADFATVFYNLTSFEISERKDKHSLKICRICKEKLLRCDVFRELCMKACTKLTPHVSLLPVEDNARGELRSNGVSLSRESNPSGHSNMIEAGFSNDHASENDPMYADHNLRTHTLHKYTDVPGTKFPCDFQDCKSTFGTKRGLSVHRKRHAPGNAVAEPKPVVCKTCGRKFASKGSLKKHSHIHNRKMPFHCAVCSKRFPTAYKLKQHKRRQNCLISDSEDDDNNYYWDLLFPCDYCDRLFSYIGNAKKHMRNVHGPHQP